MMANTPSSTDKTDSSREPFRQRIRRQMENRAYREEQRQGRLDHLFVLYGSRMGPEFKEKAKKYYHSIARDILNAYNASCIIDTGFVEHAESLSLAVLNEGLEILSDTLKFPAIGTISGFLVRRAQRTASFMESYRFLAKIRLLQQFGLRVKDVESTAEEIAFQLTRDRSIRKGFVLNERKTFSRTLSKFSGDPIVAIAKEDAGRIIGAVMAGKLTFTGASDPYQVAKQAVEHLGIRFLDMPDRANQGGHSASAAQNQEKNTIDAATVRQGDILDIFEELRERLTQISQQLIHIRANQTSQSGSAWHRGIFGGGESSRSVSVVGNDAQSPSP